MVVKTLTSSEKPTYIFKRKVGKSLIERCPVFAPDGESLAVIVENTVRFYNIKTGDCVRTLETESFLDDLVAIEFPKSENYNLYGCSKSGGVTVWTWENGAVLRELKLRIPEDFSILTFNILNSAECLVTIGTPSIKHINMGKHSLRTGDLINDYPGTIPIYYDMIRVALGVFNGDRFAALTNGTKTLFLQNLDKPYIREQLVNHNHIRIMAVAVHKNIVAISDALGRVVLLKGNIFDKKSNLAREMLHWHFLPTLAVAFSTQGNYLYSGGMEKVLVKWVLGSLAQKANDKLFMPRLSGIVKYIVANDNHVAITLTSNSVIIANMQLYATCTILECGGLSPVMRAVGGSMIYNSALGGLLMPGRTGHLQLFSTKTDKVLCDIDITQMNELPSERYNLLPLDTEVTCAAISANGSWLVTSEYRNDGINYPEERLKFWSVRKRNAQFTLNTCVNLSHGGCNVVSLALNNTGDFCVSAGKDQKFRIWKKENISLTNVKKLVWSCLTACYYSSGTGLFLSHSILNDIKEHKIQSYGPDKHPYLRQITSDDVILRLSNIHKEHTLVDDNVINNGMRVDPDTEMGEVAISQDGSLIAAWFGCKLTLWDTHLCNIRTTLSHPALRPKGTHVKFGNNDAAHYLVCATENCLAVWSLLSLSIKWYVQMKVTGLAADTETNRMAVVTANNDVFVFTPQSPEPILVKRRLLDPQTGVFKQIAFGTSEFDNTVRLYMMRNNSEVYSIEPEKTEEESRLEVMSWSNQPASKFSALMAMEKITEVKALKHNKNVDARDLSAQSTALSQIVKAAPHMVPPVSLLCTPFLEKISDNRSKRKETKRKEGEETEEVSLEIFSESSDDEEGLKEQELKLNTSHGLTPRVMELWTPNYEAVKQKKLNKILKELSLNSEATASLFEV